MTDNFKFIYKILRPLESAMDYPEFDRAQVWFYPLMKIGEIEIEDNGIRITLKGLEYLSENTIMQRM